MLVPLTTLLEMSCGGSFGKCSKISNTFLFLFKNTMVFRTGIHKMLVRITNKVDPDQSASSKQSDLGMHFFV